MCWRLEAAAAPRLKSWQTCDCWGWWWSAQSTPAGLRPETRTSQSSSLSQWHCPVPSGTKRSHMSSSGQKCSDRGSYIVFVFFLLVWPSWSARLTVCTFDTIPLVSLCPKTSIKYSLKVFILFESKSEKLLLCPEQLRQLVDNNPTNKHGIWDNKLRINAESPFQYVSPPLSGPSFWRSSGSMSPRMWWQTSHQGGPHWYLWSKNYISDWLIQFDLDNYKKILKEDLFLYFMMLHDRAVGR